MADEREDEDGGVRMTLAEHLDELRRRLGRGLVAVFLCFTIGYGFHERLGDFVLQPFYRTVQRIDAEQVEKYEARVAEEGVPRSTYFLTDDPENKNLQPRYTVNQRPAVLEIADSFWFALKVTLLFSCLLGGPYLLWQLWGFVAAGLYDSEKRVVRRYVPASVLLFAVGAAFGFSVLLPFGMYFLMTTFPVEWFNEVLGLNMYFSFMFMLTLALGVVFQIPVLMHAAVRVDLVEPATFRRYRPHFIVGAFVLGAALTPPDPYTQAFMAGPMVLLFELGIWSSRWARRSEPATAVSEVSA